MPTPTERLETRKTLQECRVCAWLATLEDKDRREWQKAISDTRFGSELIASEIAVDMTDQEYGGPPIGESSVRTHRQRRHR